MEEKAGQTPRAYERVIDYIKQEIWQGSLKQGDPLPPERELSQLLGVSRNSVREAIRTMTLMGFISSRHGAGNYVSCEFERCLSESIRMMVQLGEVNYLQISQLRRGLEGEMLRLSAKRMLPKQRTQLLELALEMEQETDAARGAALDQQYHSLLCTACGNRLLQGVYHAMLQTVNAFIGTMYVRIVADAKNAQALHSAHKQLAQALCEGDTALAQAALESHFAVVEQAVMTSLC